MGLEIPTAATDENFVWICKQHRDLIGWVLVSGPKLSGPDQNLVWYDVDIKRSHCDIWYKWIFFWDQMFYDPKADKNSKDKERAPN